MSPADGLVCGVGQVNGALFPPEQARCAALAYDFTVLAGTQGHMNHVKTDRMLEIVADQELPVVWFAEGGGGRPGDTDGGGASGLATPSFKSFAQLAGIVPKIAVVSGRCFAGNASFAGVSEILICTKGCQHRHGRAGDDRGRRPGRLRARGDRADGRADRQRRGRHPGGGRGRRHAAGQADPGLFPGAAGRVDRPPTSARCAAPSRRTGCGSTTCAR